LPDPPPERRIGDVSEIRVALPPPGTEPKNANPGPAAGAAVPAKPPPRKPIVLDADDVVIYVATLGGKKQLEKLDASGNVHVVQDAEKAGEKGLDIVGDLLNLVHDARSDLNVLTVHGNSTKFARLEMNDTILLGPKVTIDQIKNHADVDGQGAMEMPSKASLDGDRPARPGARMTVHWNKNMTFDGKIAWFFGGVQGFQDDASIKCESMQAVMDRMVVFKEGHKDGDGAKVERLVASARVYVKDEQFDKDQKLEKASRLECRELDVDNRFGPTRAVGPGKFWHLAPGDSDAGPAGQPAVPKKGPPAPAPKAKQMHLTRIDFKGWMWSNTKANFKNATFRDNVDVYHVPSETFDIALDADKLPKDGFYIRCEKLSVVSRQVDKKTVQSMIAEFQVTFKTQTDYGICDVLKFDEANDIIVLEAAPGNLVKLFKLGPGGKRDTIPGEKILYNRKDGTFTVEKAGVIRTSWLDITPARPTITSFQPASTRRAAHACGVLVAPIARA
jgi:lipopolysaccharide export system protein LptA